MDLDEGFGYDITPTMTRRTVQVVTGFSNEPGAEGEPIYEELLVNHPAGSRIEEPLDYSGTNTAVESDVDPPPTRRNRAPNNKINNSSRSEHQKFHYERERLKTFENNWKSEYHVTKEALAKDGFIYDGPKDRVRCVFCLKAIKNWAPEDVVAGEHKTLYPRCPWVNNKVHHINVPMSEAEHFTQEMRLKNMKGPKFSDMALKDRRRRTFDSWIGPTDLSVEDFIAEGFFYDDMNCCLTCFQCGVAVPEKDVSSDLKQLHASQSPHCVLVEVVKPVELDQEQHVSSSTQATSEVTVTQETEIQNGGPSVSAEDVDIEVDMGSAAVQAVLDMYQDDYSVEDIRKAVHTLRITQGGGEISSEDLLKTLDPELSL